MWTAVSAQTKYQLVSMITELFRFENDPVPKPDRSNARANFLFEM